MGGRGSTSGSRTSRQAVPMTAEQAEYVQSINDAVARHRKAVAASHEYIQRGGGEIGGNEAIIVIAPSGNVAFAGASGNNPLKGGRWNRAVDGTYFMDTDAGRYFMGRRKPGVKLRGYPQTAPSRVEVDTSHFEFAHGRKPKGYGGSWAFGPNPTTDLDKIYWAPAGTYAEAKKAAQRWASEMGYSRIYAQS